MSYDEAEQAEQSIDVGQIEKEMGWLEEEIAMCEIVKNTLQDRIVTVLQPGDTVPGVEEVPHDIHSKLATRIRDWRKRLECVRVCLEDMRDRSEL